MMLIPDATGRWAPVPTAPGKETDTGLIIYRFGADLFYANVNRFADEARALVERAPSPVRWFIIDAAAITDIDYSAARAIRDLFDELTGQGVSPVLGRVTSYLRSDLDRHGIYGSDRRDANLFHPSRSHCPGAWQGARSTGGALTWRCHRRGG